MLRQNRKSTLNTTMQKIAEGCLKLKGRQAKGHPHLERGDEKAHESVCDSMGHLTGTVASSTLAHYQMCFIPAV